MIKTIQGDCLPILIAAPDNCWDLAIVDPPYGIGDNYRASTSPTIRAVRQANGTVINAKQRRYHKDWDNQRPSKRYFDELRRVSRHQIIWGGNHFADLLPPSTGWIVWDKVNAGADQSECELAWTSFHCKVRQIEYMWRGMMQGKSLAEGRIQQGNKALNERKIHPNQKPVLLYKWLLETYAETGWSLIDTHGGSFSSAIAAHDCGFKMTIIEADDDHFRDGLTRLREKEAQLTLI